jgi:hypothetical protein
VPDSLGLRGGAGAGSVAAARADARGGLPWAAAAALGALCAVVVLAHAALLPLGKWEGDEFIQLALLDRNGLAQVAERVFGWSPRPVSETLIWAYSRLVAWRGAPSAMICLAILWLSLTAALLGAGRAGRLGVVLPLAVIAAALLVAKPGEMWFWPAGALAYLPAFGGIAAACLLVLSLRTDEAHSVATCVALLVAAGSAELGAMFVLLFAGLQTLRRLAAWMLPEVAPSGPAWVWLLPGVLAAGVILVLLAHRTGQAIDVMSGAATAPDLGASLAAAAPRFGRMLLGMPVEPNGRAHDIYLGLPLKLALLMGFRALLPPAAPVAAIRLTCLALAAALLGAAFASVVFAYRQFGLLCCERHETFRQTLVVLAILALAAALPRAAAPVRRGRWAVAGLSAFAAALVLAFTLRLPALRSDLALTGQTLAARAGNWASGRSPGEVMEFRPEPSTSLANSFPPAPGVYRRESRDAVRPPGMAWYIFAVLLYFDKLELRVH